MTDNGEEGADESPWVNIIPSMPLGEILSAGPITCEEATMVFSTLCAEHDPNTHVQGKSFGF